MHACMQNTLALLENSKTETARLREEESSQHGSVAEIMKQQDETISKVCASVCVCVCVCLGYVSIYMYVCIYIYIYIYIYMLK